MTILKRTTFIASVIVFSGTLYAQAVTPQNAPQGMVQQIPYQGVPPQGMPQQFMPRYVPQANNVWNSPPGYNSVPAYNPNYFNRSPWSNAMPMPWNNNGFNGNGFNMPWNNSNGRTNNFFPGGFNNGGNNGFPGGNFNGPWNNGSNIFPTVKGPWNNGWGPAPWSRERWKNDPMGSPSKWINFDDPKEGVAEMWEDAIKGPNRLGKMPGGWTAPSISVPNPVDVTDTFGQRWRGLPSEISEQADNFTYNVAQ